VLTLVRRARRRLLLNEVWAEACAAASAVLAAFIILLFAGTEVLNPRWLLSIPLLGAAVGACRVRRRLPPSYRVAQLLDRRLGLADAVSTAHFFAAHPDAPGASPDICRLQQAYAERLAAGADARRAVPYTMPRALYSMAALALVACSLFGLRYGMNRRLDLRQPLARMLEQALGFEPRTVEAKNTPKRLPPDVETPDSGSAPQDQERSAAERQDEASTISQDANQSQAADEQSKKADGKQQGQNGNQAQDGEQDSEGDQQDAGDGQSAGNNQGGKPDSKKDAGQKQQPGSGENSSLMSKVKDAMQNLLSRMKPQSSQNGSQQQSAADQKGNQGKGQQNGNRQQASKNGQPQQNGQPSDSQEGDGAEQAQNAQDPQGKGAAKSDTADAGKQQGSGIGSQDGEKSIRQAEQLAAMGKISEIIGKRSATLSGESTVEVQNTSQQLHTPYARRGAQHTQGGAEIHRDEVPVALQTFVAQYFEEVRKQAAPAPKK
jgi:hypothetical protein